MLNKIFQLNNGFTLMEALVAIFLITTGVLGAISVVNQTITFSQVTSSRLVATYLAQEGIEIMRNIRDTNFLKIHKGVEGINWDAGLALGEHYNFDYRSKTIPDDFNCSGKIYLAQVGNFYQCSTTPNPQNLQRKVVITPDTDILKVLVEVSWEERGRIHRVSAQVNLYKWW